MKVPSSHGKLINITQLWNLQPAHCQGEHIAFHNAMHRNSTRMISLGEMKNRPVELTFELKLLRSYDKIFRDFWTSKQRSRK